MTNTTAISVARSATTKRPIAGYVGVAMLAAILIGGGISVLFMSPNFITGDTLQGPSLAHVFGTDSSGRDIFARTLAAALADLPLALVSTVVAAVIGTTLGLLSTFSSRSESIMRVVDGFQAFPTLILILVIVRVTGGGIGVLVLTLSLLNLPRFVRIARAEALQLLSSRYVSFAQVIGGSRRYVVWRHVLPNISGQLLAQASISTAVSLSAIGAMSFLGLGIAPPTPSWGNMIQLGTSGLSIGFWWPVLFPCLGLVWSIVAANLIADSLDAHYAKEIR
jgi:peptide/nickel transport system permease protein